MSTANHIAHPLSSTHLHPPRGRVVATVVALAVALCIGVLAITGTFDSTSSSTPVRGEHLAPAVQYPGTGQPPNTRPSTAAAQHLPPAVQYPGTGQPRHPQP